MYKTQFMSYKDQPLMLFREIIAFYCENHIKHINTVFGQNVVSPYNVFVYFKTVLSC
jgi:hypothetical protein